MLYWNVHEAGGAGEMKRLINDHVTRGYSFKFVRGPMKGGKFLVFLSKTFNSIEERDTYIESRRLVHSAPERAQIALQ